MNIPVVSGRIGAVVPKTIIDRIGQCGCDRSSQYGVNHLDTRRWIGRKRDGGGRSWRGSRGKSRRCRWRGGTRWGCGWGRGTGGCDGGNRYRVYFTWCYEIVVFTCFRRICFSTNMRIAPILEIISNICITNKASLAKIHKFTLCSAKNCYRPSIATVVRWYICFAIVNENYKR